MNIRSILVAAVISFPFFSGCSSAPNQAKSTRNAGNTIFLDSPQDGSGSPASTVIDARPVALVDGQQIPWGDLKPLLTELAGPEALEEVLLDRALERAAAEQQITIRREDLDAERTMLLDSMHSDRATALELLAEMRASRGLGPIRFERLLRRTATLRAMIQPDVAISSTSIERMYRLVHGPKRQARIIVVRGLNEAQRIGDRVRAGEAFSDVATELSLDPSAARGGLLAPIAREDPAYPEPLRAALWSINIGMISDPILLEDRYAIVQYHREFPADDVQLEDARTDLERLVRLEQERVLMDQLARRLLNSQTLNIVDRSLRDMWERRKPTTP